jgi:sugar lactone lactonase YvrE
MKTIIKIIYTTFALLILTMGAVTSHGALNDLFASIGGNGENGGGFVYQYTPIGVQSIFASGLSRPGGVAFDHANNLFVATNTFDSISPTFQGAILKITPDGVQITFATVSDDVYLRGLAFDSSGNLFVMAQAFSRPGPSIIYKFTPGGVQSTFGSVPGTGVGLAFDSAGNLFTADSHDQTIYEFTPDGTASIFAGPSAFDPDQGPSGLAFDRFGNLFVSTVGSQPPVVNGDSILKFTPGGVGTLFVTGLNDPRGLAFDRSGNLFVAEINQSGPGDILKLTPDGVMTVFAVAPGEHNLPDFLAFQLLPTPRPRPSPHPRPLLP